MNDSQLNEMLAIYEEAYREAYRQRPEKRQAAAVAKATLFQCYPDTEHWLQAVSPYADKRKFTPTMTDAGRQLMAGMGRAAYRVTNAAADEPPPAPPASNGIDQRKKPGLVVNGSGTSHVTKTVLTALNNRRVKAGDTINLGDMYFWGEVVGCSPEAIPNLIQGKSNTASWNESGYQFEAVDKSYKSFTARVVAVPMSETDRKIAELERQLAELKAGR